MGAPDYPRNYLAEHWDAKSPASYTWSDQHQHNQTRQAARYAHDETTAHANRRNSTCCRKSDPCAPCAVEVCLR